MEDLNKLNEEDLSILKNVVFAKHNYGFSSEFYQAYFNLFHFYNTDEKRKNRTKDILGLLTKSD
ncbi:YARHG domain-containing protein [Fulvivirga sp. 29W222]|uniref:YARHG domain-containing protein n=1 Tax=Fulvivirga marina TaxID=2494733 RepID=A0A937KAF7_9BACT|nr:YARHG domain-containing protein [Fulvivirga marina]